MKAFGPNSMVYSFFASCPFTLLMSLISSFLNPFTYNKTWQPQSKLQKSITKFEEAAAMN
jgi:hypothetical protein